MSISAKTWSVLPVMVALSVGTVLSAEDAATADQPVVSIPIEGESAAKTDGKNTARQGAKKDHTLLLKRGQSAEYALEIGTAGSYAISIRYSNDDAGKGDDLSVELDGKVVARIETENTRTDKMKSGEGWNRFVTTADFPMGTLTAGTHRLVLRLEDDDGFGVEVDRITVKPQAK